jgi:transcriptional regulator GlxA family with amidase domain
MEKTMRATVKKRSILSASNAKKLEDLCAWITDEPEQTLGWSQLTQRSGFNKVQLIELFLLYKQVTPMAFVRQVRRQKKNNLMTDCQTDLFENIKKSCQRS